MRDDPVTTAPARCAQCATSYLPHGRQRFCSNACRQRAYRSRADLPPDLPQPPPAPAPLGVVYECPQCQTRSLDEQRCADCNSFCRRLGPGGSCPHCDEPVTLADLR